MSNRDSLYTASDLFLLRAPVLPAGTVVGVGRTPAAPEPTAAELARARADGRRRLRRLALLPRTGQALHVASPSLAAALAKPDDGGRSDRRYPAVLRYLTRMSTRSTPLGLFAGVAPGTFHSGPAAGPVVMLADDPVRATRTRADSAWLARVVDEVERDPVPRDNLRVRPNALLHRCGGSVVLVEPGDPDETDGAGPRRIELTLSRPVAVVLELAAGTPTYAELAAGLAGAFPDTAPGRIRGLLDRLWDLRVLRGDLLPAPTEPLPEVHLGKRLIDRDVRGDIVDGLARTRELADEVDRCAGRAGREPVARLEAHQRAMTPGFTGPTFQLDTALAIGPTTLPASIGAAAAEAAELLMRLGTGWMRRPHIVDYHAAFLERYGLAAELPLLDVLDPQTGLGPPGTYREPVGQHPWPPQPPPRHPRRDRALSEIVVRASHDRQLAVELTDDLVDRLTVWTPDDPRCRPRTALDVFVELAADSPAAIRDGRWRLVLSAIGTCRGWYGFGRFFDLFDQATLARIRAQQRTEEALRPDTVFAELNYGIRHRGGNLAVHPPSRGFEVCVNAAPTGPPVRQIPLDDILLGADAHHFHLRSRSLGRPLTVGQTHALNALLAPNVCRALLEFSDDGYTPECLFDWGPMTDAPFLPRLTRGTIVLRPAQWTVTATTLPGHADPDGFFHACRRWRRAWQVPRFVHLTELDNRLLLDLDHPMWVDELHRRVRHLRERPSDDGTPTLRLLEALPGPDELWLVDRRGRAYNAELAVPLVLRDRTRMPEPVGRRVAAPSVVRRWLPGEEWTHLKLYAGESRHDTIIAGPLRDLLADDGFGRLTDRWFFIRYADPLPHLRLRFHAAAPDLAAELMRRCAAWARGLVRAGPATDVAFCGYDREVERYGGGLAIDALEAVFRANSDLAVELIHLMRTAADRFDPDVVRVAALHELYRAWDSDRSVDGHDCPDDHEVTPVDGAVRRRFRALRPLLCEVLVPGERRPDLRASEYRAALGPLFARQHRQLAGTGGRVRDLARRGLLTAGERTVLESLAHMQSIRLAGLDRDAEERCAALWSLSRRAIRNRPEGSSRC